MCFVPVLVIIKIQIKSNVIAVINSFYGKKDDIYFPYFFYANYQQIMTP